MRCFLQVLCLSSSSSSSFSSLAKLELSQSPLRSLSLLSSLIGCYATKRRLAEFKRDAYGFRPEALLVASTRFTCNCHAIATTLAAATTIAATVVLLPTATATTAPAATFLLMLALNFYLDNWLSLCRGCCCCWRAAAFRLFASAIASSAHQPAVSRRES